MATLGILSGVIFLLGVSTTSGSVALERFPSVVQVESFDLENIKWTQICGGVILNVLYILSAASCFSGPDYTSTHRRIRAGTAIRESQGQVIFVSQENNHHDYVPGHVNNDISVVRLYTPLLYGDYVRNSPIASPNTVIPLGMPVVQAGWGSALSPIENLQIYGIFILKNSECNLPDDTSGQRILCGQRFRWDSYNQDIGGPWYVENITVAIVTPSVSSNVIAVPVAPYTNWIVETAV